MFEYGEVCPVSKAASVLCERWTLQIIREMLMGASRFSEFQRYLPRLSPALLNTRLRTLEQQGIVLRKRVAGKTGYEYQLTPAGQGLSALIREFGQWGMSWAFDTVDDGEMNASVIVRDFAYAMDTGQLPSGDTTIQFNIDAEETQKKFILIRDGKAQQCDDSIGYEVDVYLNASLKTLYQIWFGELTVIAAVQQQLLTVLAASHYSQTISKWLRTSQFAAYNKKQLTSSANRVDANDTADV